jgi:hypothetical protein
MISISNKIFDELLSTIEVIGVEMTINKLREAKSCGALILSDANVELVLNAVVEVIGINKERIISGNDRSDERKMAISICIYCIKSHYYYSYSQLRKIFNKDESALQRYFKQIDNLPAKPKTDFEKKLDLYYKKANSLITQRKK